MKLIGAELLKLRTTSTWWVFAVIAAVLWAVTLFFNYYQTAFLADPEQFGGTVEGDPTLEAASDVIYLASNLYTNGQFFGLLVVMLLGVIVVTNEFFHQTATTTFLTSPHRTAVIVAKLVAASIIGVLFWVITTAANLAVTPAILSGLDIGAQFDQAEVWEAIGLNGLAYLLWAIFGVGFGVLIRSQMGATVAAIIFYFAGYIGAALVLQTFANRFGDWINDLQVLVPSLASQLMVSGVDLPGSPPQWVGAIVLIGYAVVTGVVGTTIVRKRDIS